MAKSTRGGIKGSGGSSSNSNLWDYREVSSNRERLESAYSDAVRNQNKFSPLGYETRMANITRSINSAVKRIDKEIQSPEIQGNKKVLYAERRKLMMLKRKIANR